MCVGAVACEGWPNRLCHSRDNYINTIFAPGTTEIRELEVWKYDPLKFPIFIHHHPSSSILIHLHPSSSPCRINCSVLFTLTKKVRRRRVSEQSDMFCLGSNRAGEPHFKHFLRHRHLLLCNTVMWPTSSTPVMMYIDVLWHNYGTTMVSSHHMSL